MKHRTGRLSARVLGFAFAAVLVLPATAAAEDFTSPPETGPITATLPLLGSSLTVDIAIDDAGNLSSVALDPVGDFTAKVLRPHAVQFVSADGSVKVTITSWGGRKSLSAKAGTLADLVGDGTWTADIFKTGNNSTVDYTIADDGTGKPVLTITTVDTPGAITTTIGDVKTKSGDGWASSRARIEFAWHGFTKSLSIGVTVGGKHEETSARLSITLSGRKVQELSGPLANVLGDHTWSGKLCDGTAVQIAFSVVDDGSGKPDVTYDPETFMTGAEGWAKDLRRHEGFVAFVKRHWAAVLVWLKEKDDGTYKLVVGSFIGKWCKGTELADPTVNTPVDPDATKGWWGRGWHGWWNWGHRGRWGGWGGWHDRHDHDRDRDKDRDRDGGGGGGGGGGDGWDHD